MNEEALTAKRLENHHSPKLLAREPVTSAPEDFSKARVEGVGFRTQACVYG